MKTRTRTTINGLLVTCLVFGWACTRRDAPGKARVAPPAGHATVASSNVPTASVTTWNVQPTGTANFLIDAPLEKIKGTARQVRGSLQISPQNLAATRGEVDVDLGTLQTSTFDDAEKNAHQTEHAHNWLGLGKDVDAKAREENQWVRFIIRNVKDLTSNTVATAEQKDGRSVVEMTAVGSLWLHGVTADKTVRLSVALEGPATAPTRLTVKTLLPLTVSLSEHDVKPRDFAGKFLQGALEKIGSKIDDSVQCNIDIVAMPQSS